LAQELEDRGNAECEFILGKHSGHGGKLVEGRGFRLWLIELEANPAAEESCNPGEYSAWLSNSYTKDAESVVEIMERIGQVDCLVVDHYAIDIRWEQRVRASCKKLVVIDDLKNRAHDCDVLIDQNLGRATSDYSELIPAHCQVLAGTKYAILRPQFYQHRGDSLSRRSVFKFKRLLITMGGADSANVTCRVLSCLDFLSLPCDVEITVVLGQAAPWVDEVRLVASKIRWNTTVEVDVSDMAALISSCDAAIGAAGSSSWERCCLGIPTLMVVVAENQSEAAKVLSELDAVVSVEDLSLLEEKLRLFISLCNSTDAMQRMSTRSAALVDGQGCARVVDVIMQRSAR
jgi:UDP-2,4-diacetamido-2,4,6-trideoxy-beta-L-altropyranose hydrolase